MTAQSRSSLASLIIPAIAISIWMLVLTGLIYPLVTTAVANVIFPYQAQGSLLVSNGKVIGSELIGQNFAASQYFHSRLSATNTTDTPPKPSPYNAANSAASNYGPTNKKLIDSVKDGAAAYRKENGLAADLPVPVDAVTASASGLDPDISIANANLQAARVAQARNLQLEDVKQLISKNTTGRQLGILGEPRVNVLKLNLALDNLKLEG